MLIFLLIAAPLAYAVVHDFTVFIFAILCALSFAVTLLRSKIISFKNLPLKSNPFFIIGIVFIVVALGQLLLGRTVYVWDTIFDLIKFISYAFIFMTVCLNLLAQEGRKSTSETRRSMQNILRLGCLSGCTSILFHSLYDFNSHIAANSLYFTVLLALACGPGSRGEEYNRIYFKRITDTIIWTGLAIAVLAILQKFSYNGHIYWVGKEAPNPVGPYYNYDHFAGYMELCTPLAIASAVAHVDRASISSRNTLVEKILWFSTREANQTLRYIFFAMIMAATVFMSTSRGGIMSFCLTQVIFFSVIVFHAIQQKKGNRLLILSGTIFALIAIFVLWLGPKAFLERFKLTSVTHIVKMEGPDADRLMFYRDTISMIKQHPVIGTGLGTFSSAFSQHRKFNDTMGFLNYTHDDYLQLMAEMGAVFGGLIIIFYLFFFIREYVLCIRQLE